jgi:hypothetical protein
MTFKFLSRNLIGELSGQAIQDGDLRHEARRGKVRRGETQQWTMDDHVDELYISDIRVLAIRLVLKGLERVRRVCMKEGRSGDYHGESRRSGSVAFFKDSCSRFRL